MLPSHPAKTARAFTLIALIVLVLSAGGHTQSRTPNAWPGLWGAARNADSPTWPAAPPRTVTPSWRRASEGGYSEIAIAGDLAVTTELRGGIDFVVALDRATGQERWSARLAPTYRGHDGSNDGPIGTPAIDGQDVFATGPNGHLVALDLASGKERWRHDLVQAFGASVPGWGFGPSALVERNLVIVPTGGANSRGLLAFDRATGRLAWNAPHTKSTMYSSAIAASIAGTRQIVVSAGDRVFAVTPDDGKQVWSAPGPGADQEVANSPIVLPDDRVLLTYWGEAALLKISRRDGALQADQLWRSPRLRNSNGPTIYREGFLYGFAGPHLVCIDAATGDVRWRERTGEGTVIGLGPSLVLLGQTTGELRVVRASSDAFAELLRARVLTPDVMSATGPSYADGRLYLRNIKEMVALSLER